MNEARNKRKAEIEALLKMIDNEDKKYSEARREAKKENYEIAKAFLPNLIEVTLERFDVEDWYGDGRKRYEFSFKAKNGASLSIDIGNEKISSYSVTGCSDRNIDPVDFNIVTNFYSDVSLLLGFFGNSATMERFKVLAQSFKEVEWEDFHTKGLNDCDLKKELTEIEQQEKIETINLHVGSIIQYYAETKYRGSWIIVRVKKITPKKFVYVQYNVTGKKWLDDDGLTYYDTNATIDYNRIKELDEKQKEFFKEDNL